jgi:hypothetical protein
MVSKSSNYIGMNLKQVQGRENKKAFKTQETIYIQKWHVPIRCDGAVVNVA